MSLGLREGEAGGEGPPTQTGNWLPAPDHEDLQVATVSQPVAIAAGDPGVPGGGRVALSGNWVSSGLVVKRGYFPRSPLTPALAFQPLVSQTGPPGPSLCFSQRFPKSLEFRLLEGLAR